ncbi:hypothetical protein BT69DRAFT_1260875 [Atractiella rhizophila]|nr:hypothetical protein BT69DRAFT_1260875 [Atractiella rhizophila]
MAQPVPPAWKDIGKSASDLLGKDYYISSTSLEVKTTAPNGVVFKVAGQKDNKSQAISGDLEAKYFDPKHGFTFTQGWTTSNVIKNQFEIENQIAKGLKFDLATTFLPHNNAKSAIFSSVYKQSGVNAKVAMDLFRGPTFNVETVAGRDGFHVGAEASYALPAASITRYSAAVGYSAADYTIALHGLSNLSLFSASYYHRVNRDVEAGAKAVWDSKSTVGGVAMEVGCKTYLDNSAFVKAKINNSGLVCLGYTQALRPGVKASFGVAIDTQKLNGVDATGSAAHKVGAQFVFEGK